MNCSQVLLIIGLVLNTLASAVLIYPYLNVVKSVEDDFILGMDKEGNYTQKKHLKDRQLGLIGFSLLITGFIFQIIGMIVV